jgi:hypothetical protein
MIFTSHFLTYWWVFHFDLQSLDGNDVGDHIDSAEILEITDFQQKN